MKSSELYSSFFTLVRLGIGTSIDAKIPNDVNWNELKDLAEKQGLGAVVLDGIEVLRTNENHNQNLNLPDKVFLLEWIGETLQGYEYRYDLICKTMTEMAEFYNKHGFKMMILKGYACSLDWPRPEHRPCGDIDIWLFGRQAEADAALGSWLKVQGSSQEIDKSHHHHTVFYWGEFMVENHYDFIDVHHRKSGPKLEAILKELGKDDSNFVEMESTSTGSAIRVYLPSTNLHALFLLYHTMLHFTSTEMSIRQLLDWGLFVKKHTKEIDWEWFMSLVEEFHLKEFFNIINAICVEDLGFDASIFHGVQFNPYLKDRVLRDTLAPEFTEEEPKSVLSRFFFRYRRWKSHEWKHKLCFEESMWSIFWTAVWSHILKPGSI